MTTRMEWMEKLANRKFGVSLSELYPGQSQPEARLCKILETAVEAYGDGDYRLFSAPGRTELGGNHTDHQHGRVLAAAITLDTVAAAKAGEDGVVRLRSEGYPDIAVDITDLQPRSQERNGSAALVRGIAAFLTQRGFKTAGFSAAVTSGVPKGSGLSSSAAYGVLIGTIFNGLYNDNKIEPLLIARAAQYAENEYFGKPSGLMDQLSSASGCVAAIDFANADQPSVEVIDCDFEEMGYSICVVDAGGNHADLTPEYAAIPYQMRLVAQCLGKEYLAEVEPEAFFGSIGALRGKVPDRAILRAMHFFGENSRVVAQGRALRQKDMPSFLSLMNQSGRSSMELLQNVCPADAGERSLSLALALSERLLSDGGAWRVHGGGFAGTIIACLPKADFDAYRLEMESVFGQGSCYRLQVRPFGGIEIRP